MDTCTMGSMSVAVVCAIAILDAIKTTEAPGHWLFICIESTILVQKFGVAAPHTLPIATQ